MEKYGISRHRIPLYNAAHEFCVLLHKAIYKQIKKNGMLFHVNNNYITSPNCHGCT